MKKPVFLRGSAVQPKPEKAAETLADSAVDLEADEAEGLNGASAADSSADEGADLSSIEATDFEADSAAPDNAAGIAKINEELTKRLESEVKENYDKYLRAVAELENYKKRALRERADILKYAGENIARDMLEVVDNFDLALAQVPENADQEFVKGIRMIHDRLLAILQQHAVRSESSLGTIFDPNKQQALASVPTVDAAPGTVLEEFKKAYYFKDKLLRPGQVVVSAAPEGADGLAGQGSGSAQASETGKND